MEAPERAARPRGFVRAETLRFDDAGPPVLPAKRRGAAGGGSGGGSGDSGRTAAGGSGAAASRGRGAEQHAPDVQPAAGAAPGVGWALLRKAGWQPGRGLGRDESGTLQPLAPRAQRTTHGLGHAEQRALVLQNGVLRPAAGAPPAPAGSAPHSGAAPQQQQQQAPAPPAGRAWAGPLTHEQEARRARRRRGGGGSGPTGDGELPAEVQSAAARAAADDARGRAIAAALRREFAAPSAAAAGDTNPITRRSALTSSNPLLGDSDGE